MKPFTFTVTFTPDERTRVVGHREGESDEDVFKRYLTYAAVTVGQISTHGPEPQTEVTEATQ